MTTPASTDLVLAQLEQLLSDSTLAPGTQKQGARLLNRLSNPVQALVLGPSGSGKSAVINVLVGQSIIAMGCDHPQVQLLWAADAQTEVSYVDGTKQVLDGNVLAEIPPQNVASATLKLPIPFLRHICLPEITCDGAPADQIHAMDHAITRADIILWCTSDFGPDERALWDRVPDSIKDHSFLIVPKADILAAQGTLSTTIAHLENVAGDEFHSIIPVAALQAISASQDEGTIDGASLKTSGGKSIIQAVQRQVSQGRQADSDKALMFLRKHTEGNARSRPVVSRTGHANGADGTGGGTGGTKGNLTSRTASSEPEPATKQQNGAPADIFAPALMQLRMRAAELSGQISSNATYSSADILSHCVATTTDLVDAIGDTKSTAVNADAMQHTILDAADVVLLMQMENEEAGAADAVAVLLQVKRELEAGLVA